MCARLVLVAVFCMNLQRRLKQRSPIISRELTSMPVLEERSGIGVGQPERIPREPGSYSTNPYREDGALGRAGSLSAVNSCAKASLQGVQKKSVLDK